MAASYVKYLESAGARAVVVPYDAPPSLVDALFGALNGILFPGGDANLTDGPLHDTALRLYAHAMRANEAGDYFPLWGTCMGFQLLCTLTEEADPLSPVDAENISMPLDFSPGFQDSRLFASLPPPVVRHLGSLNITMNSHSWAVTLERFRLSARLPAFYTVLSTNYDRRGVHFVSTIESKRYPFYGVQWHPEKTQFEWAPWLVIPHSSEALVSMQAVANFFVSEGSGCAAAAAAAAADRDRRAAAYSAQEHARVPHFRPTSGPAVLQPNAPSALHGRRRVGL